MLKKIIGIRTVGRFRNSALPGNPTLARYTFGFGGNGFGKTTLCAVLRSLQSGDSAYVIGRKTLGAAGAPEAEFLVDNRAISFKGVAWSGLVPQITVYDGQFIAENVHSGDAVALDHKRALYRVIIGREGVGLAQEDERLAGESRAKTGELRNAERALQAHVPQGLRLEDFLQFPADAEIDAKIAEQQRVVAAVRQGSQIQARALLRELPVAELPANLLPLLAKTLEGVAQDTERRVAEHLAAHEMAARGQSWLAEGVAHIRKENCPFCGQSVKGLPLIAAYRALFSDAYAGLKGDVQALSREIDAAFGDRAIGAINTMIEQNIAGIEFWRQYCTISEGGLAAPADLAEALAAVRAAMLALLDRKARAPLERIEIDEALNVAALRFKQARAAAIAYNEAIKAANAVIAKKKTETGAADIRKAEAELTRLEGIKARHKPEVAQACAAYATLQAEKRKIDERRSAVREQLDEYSRKVIKPYEQRINDFLDSFNAGFRIAETTHAYPGGIATSNYQLVINKTAVDVGDGSTPLDRPSFKNTLSAGDRSTLALAFFLADLERAPDRADRIVVVDDPMTSQDAFRRRQTIHEIRKVGNECAQVIVWSHDAGFLRQIWEKCPADQRVAIQLADHREQGTKITACDLDEACRGRVASEMDDLQAYLTTGAGRPRDIIKKVRIVLETHCRSTYPGYFGAGDMLGVMVEQVKKAGDQHPAWPIHEELDLINDFSRDHHHGEDPTDGTAAEQIDPTELSGFVKRTLRLVNNLQA